MKIQRTIPPTAAPIGLKNLLYGLAGIFFGKEYLKRLEDEMKEYFGVKHVFLVSSGKAALTIILKALKTLSSKKTQVVTPAYTCFSVPSAIVKAGLKVSLCDIDPSNFDFDYKLVAEAIREDTLCVIPNHLFGIPVNIDRINSLCKARGIFVVEDAAQAMGGISKGRKLGTLGDAGFFSLGRGKNVTCGSGGVIVTNSDIIADTIRKEYGNLPIPGIIDTIKEFTKVLMMSIFINPSLYWFPSGLPFLKLGETIFYKEFPIKRLSGMKAGILRNWQNKLEESNRIRLENAEYFCSALASTLTFHNGASIPYLRLPLIVENKEIKEKLYSLSNKKGFGISYMYPTPINEIEEIKESFNGKFFPSAEKISERLLTIPTHHLLSEKDKEKISYQLLAVSTQLKAESCTITSKSVPICHSRKQSVSGILSLLRGVKGCVKKDPGKPE
jgi:dTDP-4-amino-4,6-dideoxygalactose transaminase